MKISIVKKHMIKIIDDRSKMQTGFYYKNIQFIYTIKPYKSLFPQKWQTFMHMCLTAYELEKKPYPFLLLLIYEPLKHVFRTIIARHMHYSQFYI